MKAATLILIVVTTTATLSAQEQETGMLERIHNPQMESNRMQDKAFSGGTGVQVRVFNTGEFQGSKSASTSEYKTKSFLGIRNPWFGSTVHETSASMFANRSARKGGDTFITSTFAVDANSNANRSALIDEQLPNSVKPRETALPSKSQGSVDRFTQNLTDDLSIDQVRDLLNKGKQNR
jgi:hypothetical protein